MPAGSSACIPAYDSEQVSFQPKLLLKGVPTTFIFNERGEVQIPKKTNY